MPKRAMRRNMGYVLTLVLGFGLAGCASTSPDYHVVKCGLPYDKVIANPYEWSLMQLADGPVSGPEISDYARIVIAHGLEEATGDLNGDGVQELVIRQGSGVLCFAHVRGGFRYIGDLCANTVVPPGTSSDSVLVYNRCGGHCGFIRRYRHNGVRFECISTEEIWSGDGYPEENARRLAELFSTDRRVSWIKVPDKKISPDVQMVHSSFDEAAIAAEYDHATGRPIPAETMEKRLQLWDSVTAVDETGKQSLAAYKDWVYWQEFPGEPYVRLLPGICPQWIPKHKGQEDRWFYLFLPVGYDGKSELWIGSTRGNYLGKAADGLFVVNSTPVLSPDRKALASVLRPLVTVQGDRVFVSVIFINSSVERASVQQWVYKGHGVSIANLRFVNATTLSFELLRDGEKREETIAISSPY